MRSGLSGWCTDGLRYSSNRAPSELITALLVAGVDVSATDRWGSTALHVAASKAPPAPAAVVAALLEAGTDASATQKYGKTAADLAELRGHSALASYIVGAQSWTALHFAAHARDADALRECLSSGARPDAAVESPHADMRTALSIAGSDAYPTARPVDEECLALLQPALVKGVAPGGGSGGGGGGSSGDSGGGSGGGGGVGGGGGGNAA